MAIQSKAAMKRIMKDIIQTNKLSFICTPLNRYPTFYKKFINQLKEKENEMIIKKTDLGNCWNKRCGARNMHKIHKCEIGKGMTNCRKWVSFADRKLVNKPNQPKSFIGSGEVSIDLEVKGLRKFSKIPSYNFNNLEAVYLKNEKQDNSYTFRGEINIDHLINDCIKDKKNCFVAIGKKEAILGISRQLPVTDKCRLINQLKGSYEDDIVKSFYIIDFELKDVPFVVKELPKISKKLRNKSMKIAKKLKKASKQGKFSKMPETKIMVF